MLGVSPTYFSWSGYDLFVCFFLFFFNICKVKATAKLQHGPVLTETVGKDIDAKNE